MDSMGFVGDDGDLPVSSFSGGWKMRIGLGKVLLQDPNVLMLDEPTNHLDLDSVEWLEDFLRNQQLPMIIVSHDREFLDRVCTKIVDTDGGECTTYQGNYSNFLKQKKARMDAWEKAWTNQQKKIQEDKNFINQYRNNNARSAQVSRCSAPWFAFLYGVGHDLADRFFWWLIILDTQSLSVCLSVCKGWGLAKFMTLLPCSFSIPLGQVQGGCAGEAYGQ